MGFKDEIEITSGIDESRGSIQGRRFVEYGFTYEGIKPEVLKKFKEVAKTMVELELDKTFFEALEEKLKNGLEVVTALGRFIIFPSMHVKTPIILCNYETAVELTKDSES